MSASVFVRMCVCVCVYVSLLTHIISPNFSWHTVRAWGMHRGNGRGPTGHA